MPTVAELRAEIDALVLDIWKLRREMFDKGDLVLDRLEISSRYQPWYSVASRVVHQLLPERHQEFTECYRNTKRKEISIDTYDVSDYLKASS